MPQKPKQESPLGRLVVLCALGWVLLTFPPGARPGLVHFSLWWFGVLCAAAGALNALMRLAHVLLLVLKLASALGRDDSHGTAGFMVEREARAAGLHRRKRGRRLVGTIGGTPLWLGTETHHLIIGPSGTQKTSAVINNILMGSPESAFVTDIKGELYATTSRFRARRFGHRSVKIDPADPVNSVKINPLDMIAADVEAGQSRALTRVRGMALQLHPDPKGGGGQNEIFYKGGRGLIVTTILAAIVVLPKEHRTLAMVYRTLSDLTLLGDMLDTAALSPALSGEIADMARSTHETAFGDDGNAKTFESFRMNALLALEAFGPGNHLARITSETTFDFAELKRRSTTVYVVIDFANSEVLAQFAGLMQWMAIEALVAVGNNKPVQFVLDEFCNAPLHILPKVLTLLRSAGIKVTMATQDLDDITRVYSKHTLETVLSEADIKQFLGGIRSETTLKHLSAALGAYSEISSSYALGREDAQESVSRMKRALLTEDELRRMPKSAQIIFFGNQKPMLAKKVQVFAIAPWRRRLGINKIYGTRRKLLPVEIRVGWWGTTVTARGRRAYRRMIREIDRKRVTVWRRLLGQLVGAGVPVAMLVLLAALAVASAMEGLPNLRVSYGYRGSALGAPAAHSWCRYVGPTSPGLVRGGSCPLILWRKSW